MIAIIAAMPDTSGYVLTEQKALCEIGKALSLYDDVIFVNRNSIDIQGFNTVYWSDFPDVLKEVDIAIWGIYSDYNYFVNGVLADMCNHYIFANGWINHPLEYANKVKGILCMQKWPIDQQSIIPKYKHIRSMYIDIPLSLEHDIAHTRCDDDVSGACDRNIAIRTRSRLPQDLDAVDDYALVSGGLFPSRNMHLPLLAMMASEKQIPIHMVYQPYKDYRWRHRDPKGNYRKVFDFSVKLAKDNGIQISEQDTVDTTQFQDMLRKAKMYFFCDETGFGGMICREVLAYGVPLISTNKLEYTNKYYYLNSRSDWHARKVIASKIDGILEDYDEAKQRSVAFASEYRERCSHEVVGKQLISFLKGAECGTQAAVLSCAVKHETFRVPSAMERTGDSSVSTVRE